MNSTDTAQPKKNTKKLYLFSLAVFLLLGAVSFLFTVLLGFFNEMNLIERYIVAFPRIVEERAVLMEEQEEAFNEDFQSRGELAARLFEEYDELDIPARLACVRDAVSARSTALLDAGGRLRAVSDQTPGAHLWDDAVQELMEQGENALMHLKSSEDDLESIQSDTRENAVVMLRRLSGSRDQLLVECDDREYAEMRADYGNWNDALDRMLMGLDAFAFVHFKGTDIVGPNSAAAALPDEILDPLYDEVMAVFTGNDGFVNPNARDEADVRYSIGKLAGQMQLMGRMEYPERDAIVMLAVPVRSFFRPSLLAATALTLFLGCSILLFVRYLSCRERGETEAEDGKTRRRTVRRGALPGLLILLVSTGAFTALLLALDSKAEIASDTMSQRRALQYEIDYSETQQRELRAFYPRQYLIRTQALAKLLSDRPEKQNRETLQEYLPCIGAEYLMLFDRNGQERTASNSFTAFSVEEDETYRPLLLGYPSVVTEPATDTVTGQFQYTVATLITDEEGLPDGFLLAAVSADALSEDLSAFSLTRVVGDFTALDMQTAAVVDEASGRFISHTQADMVGRSASEVLNPDVLNSSYEGFTRYDWKNVYLSASENDGRQILVTAPGEMSSFSMIWSALLCLVLLLILGLLYFPISTGLCAEGGISSETETGERGARALLIFPKGYVVCFAVLAVFSACMSRKGVWPAFEFVFSRQWTKGVHLFSVWAALFFLSVTLSVAFILRALLAQAERAAGTQAKTVLRLADSLVIYAAIFLLVFYVLSLFGVDTTTLLASAGIISIAVGMGAKDLIADILAGMFLIFEGSVHVGDEVSIGSWSGTVTDMGIRTMEVTNDAGDVKIISNARIGEIVNKNRKANP